VEEAGLMRAIRGLRTLGIVLLAGSCGGEAIVGAPSATLSSTAVRATGTKRLSSEPPLALHVTLDDPRFAAVKERLRARDAVGAARAFEDARASVSSGADASSVCAIDFTAGRLHRDASQDTEAAHAFEGVAPDCALAPYAALYASQAEARLGRTHDAIAHARRVPDDVPVAPEARLVEAEARAAKGDRAGALVLWRAHLAASPHGVRWVDTSVKIANALLDGIDGDPGAHATEALDLATRVVVEAPKLADASGAQLARDRAIAVLRVADPRTDDALSPADHARRAQAWLDVADPARAIAEATPLLALPAGPESCHASLVRAQATVKLRGAAADAYGDAIARCALDDSRVTALFAGAKASLSAKRTDEALARFAEVEASFPKHRLADDARLREAMIAQQTGDEARAEELFASLDDAYPEGDMRTEALFRLALARMTRGDWAGASAPLDRILAIEPDDRRNPSAGRAAYFRARVSAMAGDEADAAARYESVIAKWPLAYAMVQAYGRLAAIDPARARRAADEASSREAALSAATATPDHAELHSPSFDRGRALLEVGEIDSARREMGRAVSDATDPEVLWILASLYERAGAPEVAQSLVGARLPDYLAHWPAAGWRARWEVAYPRAFGDLVEQASTASKIPAALTWAIMRQESQFVADAKSASDAYGLMQILVPTARGLAKGTPYGADPDSLTRPEVSITLGAKYLGQLRANYPGNRALAIAAYNGGGGAVGRWLSARGGEDFDLWVEEIPFDETRGYVKRVLSNEAAYAYLYAPATLDEVLSLPLKVTR
jgi:soluble lytic murein transglycosylase